MLQLAELGARQRDPPLLRAEVDEHGVVFHAEYDAEPVLVVGYLIVDGEYLGRGRRSRGSERAAGQVAPGRGARSLHNTIVRLPSPGRGRLAEPNSGTGRSCAATGGTRPTTGGARPGAV